MPSLTTTIEDVSPLILYSGNWQAGTSADNSASSYSASSFTVSQSDGASASFQFNGTGVQIFGARRQNHGLFQINVDGNMYPPISGTADPAKFQDTLFSTTTLQQGLHNVTLINNGNSFVDIDFITWQTDIGSSTEQLIVNTVQDTDTSFTYQPSSSWNTNPENIGSFFGGSGHATSTPGASLVYTFEGDGVSLYGPVGPSGSPYSVQLDGGSITHYNPNKQFYTPQVELYRADNLGPGSHSLKLLYQPVSSGQVFAIDHANVYTTPSISGTVSRGRNLAGGTVAGIVIAILVILALLAGLFVFLRRRRARAAIPVGIASMIQPRRNGPGILATSGMTWEPFAGKLGIKTTVPAVVSFPSSYSAMSDDTTTLSNQTIESRNQFPGSQPTSLIAEGSEYSSSSYNALNPGSLIKKANSTSPKAPKQARTVKGAPSRLPPAAGQSLAQVPDAELRANRMVVDGRPQDFGTVAIAVTVPPPPDYSQATEPYNIQRF